MFWKKFAVICVGVVASIWMSGCGGSAPAVSVSVTAAAGTVDGGDTTTLTATVSNDQNSKGVTWTVSGGGTLSSSTTTGATYTAPAASSSALSVTVTATSVADTSKSSTATIAVPAAPAIATTTLAANVGTAFSSTLAATGGIAPYTWALTQGTLPIGWTLSTAGVVSGTAPVAAEAGAINLTIGITDSGTPTALTATQQVVLTISPAPAITFTGAVPATATYNVAYSGSAAATGGVGALTYSLVSGALPGGLTLNAATGAITGTPSASGTFPFTVKAADAYGDSASKAYSIVASYPTLTITSAATLPIGYVGATYDQVLAASGGSGSGYTWALKAGSLLPAGLTLSSTGAITGKPTASGPSTFTITLTDSASNTANATFSLTINPAVSITNGTTLPSAYVGSNYSLTMAATGGSGTGYKWTVTSGSTLPGGLTLSAAGVLSGAPTTAGTPSFSVTVTDSASNTATATFSITILPGVSITPVTLPAGYPGTAYPATTLAATGGSATGYKWTWAAASGSTLPAGLSLSTAGVITGSPTNSTTSSVTSSVVVTVTDSVGNQATLTTSVTIEASVAITTASLPGATVGVNYSHTLAASGGSGTYTSWQVTSGATSLSAIGLALSTTTGVISGASPTSGTANFSVAVTDSQGHVSAAASFTVTASSALTVTTASLNPLNIGQTPTQVMTAAGGSGITADYSWSWTAAGGSSLPPGLTLGANGVIGGSPTTAGSYSVVVKVQDSGSSTSATATLSITIYATLTLPASSSLPAGYTGVAYNGTIAASGGSGNYCYRVPTAAQYTAGIWDGLQTASPNASSSTGCNYYGSSLPISGTPTNPPAPPYSISLSIPVTDTTTGQTITQVYIVSITAPPAPSLPASNPAAATVGQSYTGSITTTGGVGPNYTWTINGTVLATNGSPVSIGDGLSVSNNGTDVLSISGSPTSVSTSPGVQFTAQVKDSTTGLTSGAATTYTIVVNSAGSQVNGQIGLNNNCGGVNVPTITVNLYAGSATSGTPVQTVTTSDSQGDYSFSTVPSGSYTIVPSITGPSSVFYPASQSVTLSGSAVTGENFSASLGYTVSGTVSYSGAQTGQVYLNLNNTNCGGSGGEGTSITDATLKSTGAYTIRGVAPGNYTLQAWMDTQGFGAANADNPVPLSPPSVTVVSSSPTGQNVTLADPATVSLSGSAPKIKAVSPFDQGALILSTRIENSNQVEIPASYTIQWSTSSTWSATSGFSTVAGSKSVVATGNQGTPWIVGGLTNGQAYYFSVQGVAGSSTSNFSPVVGPVTIGAPTGGNTVSGTVTFSQTAKGPLYVAFVAQNTNAIYATVVGSQASPPSSPATYSVQVPTGSNYSFFAILDQNNNGILNGPGEVSNIEGGNNQTVVSISGATTEDLTLPTANSTANVTTQYTSSTSPGGSSTGYSLNFEVRAGIKLPVAVTLTSGPNMINPVDIGNLCSGCGSIQFQLNSSIGDAVPKVNDPYTFKVTYSDGTVENGTVTAAVTGVLTASQLATNLAPTVTGGSTTPTFTWTYPAANASSYIYQFNICCDANGTIWQIPGNDSNLNGFTVAEDTGGVYGGTATAGSIPWNTDPSGSGSSPSVTSLNTGTQYNWQIQTQDSNGNSAQNQVYYIP